MALVTRNPTTGDVIREYEEHSDKEARQAVSAAHSAFLDWRFTDFEHRAVCLKKSAQLLRRDVEELAKLVALEMGKPLTEAKSEVEKCAWACDYYAENGERLLESELVETDATKSYVAFKPLGVVLGIMPWNFPIWQVVRFAAPTMMAGNAVIVKHAEIVSGCAEKLNELFEESGFPKDLFSILYLPNERVAPVIHHPKVAAVSLTGSTQAGRAVAAHAGAALKKVVLELGGSDPYVVLEDADLESTVQTCVTSRMVNCGQSCVAAKRFIVVQGLVERFTDALVKGMSSFVMGDPVKPDVNLGPMARFDLRDTLHDQVSKSVERGAVVLLGGEVPDMAGAFYPPTVLSNVQPGMPAFSEEMFGPVASVIAVPDEEEALRLAATTSYGLGAAVFTQDIERGERIAADHLEAGLCFVNTMVKSDPRLPFGGIKSSGYGRELGGFGIREFVNVKTVYLA
ncbi:MAG: NAD-dependent succinate-semialdehyde dehydrogenase [Gemmatimonadota bacterium]|nr:NAD-dependent succinate-semialdehyde dehydrogenase [Gemmatimonadota bacterium]MDH5804152.1 NAD-dependent succinate-semialdehyde dehydrogenase [Gemmatimonadota bacterium]